MRRTKKTHWHRGCRVGVGIDSGKLHYNALAFMESSKANPDWYCATCATKARLALAKESAPKPSDVVWPTPRPISEAPTDGSMVLIRLPDYDPQWTIGVFDPRRRWVDLCLATAIVEPTHFLPLPPEVR